MATVPKESRLLALALLNYADDEGYFAANDQLIRGECFPFDEDSTSIQRGLDDLSRIGFLVLGKSDSGQRVGRITNFLEHQRIDRASPSKFSMASITWDQADTNSASPRRSLNESSPLEVEVEVDTYSVAASAPLICLPLVGKGEAPITQAMVDEWTPAYPAVNVLQALREMRAWLLANPANRKTARGVQKFVVGWLSRAQNKAPRTTAATERKPWEGAH